MCRLHSFRDISENWNLLTLIIHGIEVLLYTKNIYYVTVNMCNQGIHVFPENFSEYAYSLKWSGNTCIP